MSPTPEAVRYQLDHELQGLPAPAKDTAEKALTTESVVNAISTMLKENGELFGAYRAVGNGGLPERVLKAFTGSSRTLQKLSLEQVKAELHDAQVQKKAVTASTGTESLEQLRGQGVATPGDAAAWYVAQHAYTVLDFDGANVTLRNPWGDHPLDTQGIVHLPVASFAALLPYMYIE
jgi:hypothetical protein